MTHLIDSQTIAVTEIFGEALLDVDEESRQPLMEAFNKINALLGREDQGWVPIFGGGQGELEEQFGLTLENLKEWGRKIREAIVGAPWIGAGFRRRQHYIWEGGIRYGNIPGGGTRGRTNIQAIINRSQNQSAFFAPAARRAREECLYSEGIAFWIGNERTKDLEAIPLRQIKDHLLEPNGLGYAIAYKRVWTRYNLETGESKEMTRWYFTERHVSRRVKSIRTKFGNEVEIVDQEHVIFDQIANQSTGLVYGSPDAVAAFIWNNIARDAVMDGRAVTKSLATFALKAQVKNGGAGKTAAMKLATTEGAGNTAIVGQANDLVPLQSAGKGYDFAGLRFLVAIVASALDISVIHLTANPGDAGSSYGSAQTLDLPTKLAMEARRAEHVEIDKRVLRWMGVEDPDVGFVPYEAGETTYRSLQGVALALQNNIIDRQEFRNIFDDLLGRPNGDVPSEEEMPAVILARLLAAIDTTNSADEGGQQVASPNQGRSNGTGGQSGGSASNDIQDD